MRSNAVAVLSAVVQGLGGVGIPLLASNLITPSEMGILSLAMVGIVVMRALGSLGFHGTISIVIHNSEGGETAAFALVRRYSFVALPLAAITSLAGAVTQSVPAVVLLTVSTGISYALALLLQSLFRSTGQQLRYVIASIGPTSVAQLAGLLGVLVSARDARTYMVGLSIASLVCVAALVLPAVRTGRGPVDIRRSLAVGWPLVLTALSTAGLAVADRPIVRTVVGEDALGRYHITYLLASAAIPLMGGLSNAWLPQVLAYPAAERMGALRASARRYGAGFTAIGVGAGVATPGVMALVIPESYQYGSLRATSLVVCLGVVPYIAYSAATIALIGNEATRHVMHGTLLGVGVGLASLLALTVPFGLVGAAFATVIGYGVTAWSCARSGRLGMASWLSRRELGAVAIGLVLLVTVQLAAPIGGVSALVRLLVGALLGVGGLVVAIRPGATVAPAVEDHGAPGPSHEVSTTPTRPLPSLSSPGPLPPPAPPAHVRHLPSSTAPAPLPSPAPTLPTPSGRPVEPPSP